MADQPPVVVQQPAVQQPAPVVVQQPAPVVVYAPPVYGTVVAPINVPPPDPRCPPAEELDMLHCRVSNSLYLACSFLFIHSFTMWAGCTYYASAHGLKMEPPASCCDGFGLVGGTYQFMMWPAMFTIGYILWITGSILAMVAKRRLPRPYENYNFAGLTPTFIQNEARAFTIYGYLIVGACILLVILEIVLFIGATLSCDLVWIQDHGYVMWGRSEVFFRITYMIPPACSIWLGIDTAFRGKRAWMYIDEALQKHNGDGGAQPQAMETAS